VLFRSTAPLVLGRLVAVNGEELAASPDTRRAQAARHDHKLSQRAGNIDDVVLVDGAWWTDGPQPEPKVAMEDREALRLGVKVGDRLRYDIVGAPVEVTVAAIYGQRRFQARLWLEGIMSDGVLDPFITRHVGAAWLPDRQAQQLQDRLAATMPNVVTMRTEQVLAATREIMGRAGAGLAVIGVICLAASLLVLASVVAASRSRQAYESSVMHALGARLSSLRWVLRWEYGLLAGLTAGFAIVMGSGLAYALLELRLALDADGLWWTGVVVAFGISGASLGLGAQVLLRQLQVVPARLLRSGAR
jgi:putative ABC transport system permease protein